MWQLEGRLAVQIFFNGKEFPFKRINTLDFLHLSGSTKLGVPMLHMALIDTVNCIADEGMLADAIPIRVSIGTTGESATSTYHFRLNSWKQSQVSSGTRYEIDGYLDVPNYWNGSSMAPIRGSSSSVLSQICQDNGLTFKGDPTSDTQVWWPRNTTNHEWARQIAERGYISDQSCMQMGVGLDKTLVYKNIASMDSSPTTKFLMTEVRADYVTITDYKPLFDNGSANNYSGYNEMRIEQNPLNDSFRIHEKVTFNKNEQGKMMVNPSVQGRVGRGRVQFSSLNPGNVHENYERAFYQNRRVNNLFTSGLKIITPNQCKTNLLDTVSVTIDQTEHVKVYSGLYRVAAKAIYILGVNYCEAYEMYRRTINSKMTQEEGVAQTSSKPLYTDVKL